MADDARLGRALRMNQPARGGVEVAVGDAAGALRAAADREPEVVVLDLGLPDLDGTDVIGELRRFTAVPIVVLSARTDSADKVGALDRGADDYVTKPFGMDELLARLRAAGRRAGADGGPPPPPDARVQSQDRAHPGVRPGGEPGRRTPTQR